MKNDIAYIISDNTLFYAEGRVQAGVPHSPVTRLIQGVYSCEPDAYIARTILRHRIFFTGQASQMCHGMVKIAAKRLTDRAPFPDFSTYSNLVNLGPQLISPAPGQTDIKARLLSPDGVELAFAENNNLHNKTWHAEVLMVQKYYEKFGGPIPRGAIIDVTLEPCLMCISMIEHCCEAPDSVQIRFQKYERGTKISPRILQSNLSLKAHMSQSNVTFSSRQI